MNTQTGLATLWLQLCGTMSAGSPTLCVSETSNLDTLSLVSTGRQKYNVIGSARSSHLRHRHNDRGSFWLSFPTLQSSSLHKFTNVFPGLSKEES